MNQRGSGLLLHITSLPSPHGIGDLGPAAYKFADLLADCRQRYWQVLPLNPTDPIQGNSPYSSKSAFAMSPLLLSPDLLLERGLLDGKDLETAPRFPAGRVDFPVVIAWKEQLIDRTFHHWEKTDDRADFERFCDDHARWLNDYVLFAALKEERGGQPWNEWPTELRDRSPSALVEAERRLADRILREKIVQFLLHEQWTALKGYCNHMGIRIIGDLPIYVTYDSSDAWSHPELFKLDEQRRPVSVAGVPPDYFSATGQRWGNPVYNWEALRESRYTWWIERLERTLKVFDLVRVDHFRGLVAYWEVPESEPTAVNGKWVNVPADDFFTTLGRRFGRLPIIAEDLGIITPDVREVMSNLEAPGMKVLLFAFSEDHPLHPYLPHTYSRRCVAYTGTHDNNTTRGWFETEAGPDERRRLSEYLGRLDPEAIHWDLIRLAMGSVAETVIFPVQDVLGLGADARMNTPAIAQGNWEWRLRPELLIPTVIQRLKKLTWTFGRA